MANLPISWEQALLLIEKYNKDRPDINHYLETEAIMGALAKRLGEDEAYWRMLGLLHDVDWGVTKENTNNHLTKAPEILREAGFDEEFIKNIVSHGFGYDCAGLKDNQRKERIEHALACAETVTGLIHAYALMRKGIKDMEANGLKKKFKDKKFAAAVRRDIIMECGKLGLGIDEFFELSINAVREIAANVGLD